MGRTERRLYILLFSIIFGLSRPSSIYSEEAKAAEGGNRLTLGESLKIALSNHLPAKIAQEQINLAEMKVKEARRNLYPVATGEVKYTEGNTITDPFKSESLGLQLEQPLYLSGKLKYTLRREELGLDIAEKNYHKVKLTLTGKVQEAYYNLIRGQMMLKLQQELQDDAQAEFDMALRRYDAGLSTQIEFLDVQSQYNQISFAVAAAKRDLNLARISFAQVLNIDFAITEDIDYELSPEIPEVNVTVEDCLELAYLKRPEMRIVDLVISSAEYGKRITKGENKPKLTFSTSYGKSGEAFASESLDLADTWTLLGKMTWLFGASTIENSLAQEKTFPTKVSDITTSTDATTLNTKFSVLDQLVYYSQGKEAEIVYEQARNEKMEVMHSIETEVNEAYHNYLRSRSHIDSSLERRGFYRKRLEVLKARRSLDEVLNSEVLRAKTELADSEADYMQGLYNYYLALASLNKAIGADVPALYIKY